MTRPICTKCGKPIYGEAVEDVIHIGHHKLDAIWHEDCYETGFEGGIHLSAEDLIGWKEYVLEVKG